MTGKRIIIALNWIAFIFWIVCTWGVIVLYVSAYYHPGAPGAPTYKALPGIWFPALFIIAILTIALSLLRKRLSKSKMILLTLGTYFLVGISMALLIARVETLPDYTIHSVGEVKYRVPKEFTQSTRSLESLQISICIESLKGIYDPTIDCSYEQVGLYETFDEVRKDKIFSFSQRVNEFDFNDETNSISLNNDAKQYEVPAGTGLKDFTYDKSWSPFDRDDEVMKRVNYPIHLQVDEQNNRIVRFVSCTQSTKYDDCEHIVITDQGTLTYTYVGSVELDLNRWQAKEKEIFELINQWRID
ncbi:MAG: hypothetical protein AAF827_07570 [Cyanobacteria bacterium P01_D01_bin.6]